MNSYFLIKKLSLSEERAFGLDSSSVKIEIPMVLHAPKKIGLTRVNNNRTLKTKKHCIYTVFFLLIKFKNNIHYLKYSIQIN
jgi:hypothetical protein